MVLRSDLTLAFFSADSFVRVGLVKTATQQVRVPPKLTDWRYRGRVGRLLEPRTNPMSSIYIYISVIMFRPSDVVQCMVIAQDEKFNIRYHIARVSTDY